MPPQAQHLESLSRSDILETPLAEVFDRIVRLATGIFAVPIATISLATSSKFTTSATPRSAALNRSRVGNAAPT